MNLSDVQRDLLRLMAAGVRPTIMSGPGQTVSLPEPHARRWRTNHNGRPVQENTLSALQKRGMISKFGSGHRWIYQITERGREEARAAVPDR